MSVNLFLNDEFMILKMNKEYPIKINNDKLKQKFHQINQENNFYLNENDLSFRQIINTHKLASI
jgi:hypothetical protein